MNQYQTKEGDMVDWICYQFYGSTEGVTEQVYEINAKLADYGSYLPARLLVLLPEIEVKSKSSLIRLWD